MRARISVAVAVLAVLASLTSPAYAEKHVATDRVGDVLAFDNDSVASTPAPDMAESDIVKSAVRHGRHRVLVRLRLRDLKAPTEFDSFLTWVDVKSDAGRSYAALIKFGGSKVSLLLQGDAGTRNCRRAKLTFSPAEDLITTSIPRKCLGNPNWIRVGMAAIRQKDGLEFRDDALRGSTDLHQDPEFTPKLKRR